MTQIVDTTTPTEAEKNQRGLRLHLWTFAIVLPVLAALNLFLTPGDWWVLWAAGAWTVGIVLHVVSVRIMYAD